ncbi:MAG TPA: alpha/beta fold hydrolase, partial [Longimicrobium sp.]|nr:alpha/beta fold hydrolase [Longimicrobium sp.]
GRLDHQVKIRGFRIELGEIHSTLLRHPGVQDAAVVDYEHAPGDRRIAAYVVPHPQHAAEARRALEVRANGGAPSANGASAAHEKDEDPVETLLREVRKLVRERLPEYMAPAAFVPLAALPLSPNGKLDRRALPKPASDGAAAARAFAPPRTPAEERLAEVWRELLGVERVGREDGFFDLGGHSLLAMRLIARVREAFGRTLPVSALFESPTLAQLAERLEEGGAGEAGLPLVALRPEGSRTPFFLVHPAGGSVLGYHALARRWEEDRPLYALQAPGLREGETPLDDVEEMAALYLRAVRGVQPEGPYLLGGWSMGGVVAAEMARQLRAVGEEVALLALIDTVAREPDGWQPDERELLAAFAADLGVPAARLEAIAADADPLARLAELALAERLVEGEVVVPQLRRMYHVFRHNLLAMQRWRPRPYDGPVAVFPARELLQPVPDDGALGWSAYARGGLWVSPIAGTHYTMVREPQVRGLAAALAECIARHDAAEAAVRS